MELPVGEAGLGACSASSGAATGRRKREESAGTSPSRCTAQCHAHSCELRGRRSYAALTMLLAHTVVAAPVAVAAALRLCAQRLRCCLRQCCLRHTAVCGSAVCGSLNAVGLALPSRSCTYTVYASQFAHYSSKRYTLFCLINRRGAVQIETDQVSLTRTHESKKGVEEHALQSHLCPSAFCGQRCLRHSSLSALPVCGSAVCGTPCLRHFLSAAAPCLRQLLQSSRTALAASRTHRGHIADTSRTHRGPRL